MGCHCSLPLILIVWVWAATATSHAASLSCNCNLPCNLPVVVVIDYCGVRSDDSPSSIEGRSCTQLFDLLLSVLQCVLTSTFMVAGFLNECSTQSTNLQKEIQWAFSDCILRRAVIPGEALFEYFFSHDFQILSARLPSKILKKQATRLRRSFGHVLGSMPDQFGHLSETTRIK